MSEDGAAGPGKAPGGAANPESDTVRSPPVVPSGETPAPKGDAAANAEAAPPSSPVETPGTPDVAPTSKFTGTPPAEKKPKKKRKWLRRIGCGIFLFIPIAVLGLWIAIHKIDGFGPWLANLGRSIVGNDAIARLEDWAYGVQDRVNLATRGDEKPQSAWEVTPRPERPKDDSGVPVPTKYPDLEIKDVGPMVKSFAAPGDGIWVPMIDDRFPDEPAPMLKTLLHPDPKRGWAQVAVVAIDLRQVDLHLVAGSIEPVTTLADAKTKKRPGVVAPDDLGSVIAAFNGGFMATHGHYGMKSEGTVWIEPKGKSCTIVQEPGDVIAIRSWEEFASKENDLVWYRQTPMCMVENGTLHPGLAMDDNTYWGATLDKETIIRRSAMGISEDGKTLFVGIGEATSAVAIAKAMQFAGAFHVAQLDVNFSYPKFVTIAPKAAGSSDLELKGLVKTFEFKPDDYVKRPHTRDFFYVTRLPLPLQKDAAPKDTSPKDAAPKDTPKP